MIVLRVGRPSRAFIVIFPRGPPIFQFLASSCNYGARDDILFGGFISGSVKDTEWDHCLSLVTLMPLDNCLLPERYEPALS